MTFMTRPPCRAHLGALFAVGALALAACGSDDDSSTEAMNGMDHSAMGMNMGDADATPAEEVEGAELSRGEFQLLDTRPAGYDDVAGTAVIARHASGTTVTLEVSGLPADVDFISHVHEAPCSENGGDHFQFIEGPVEVPPNEIHLAFTSDADGNGFMTAENDAVAPADAVALVIHPAEFMDNKAACVDFVADEGADIEAAIAAGPAFDESLIKGMDAMDMDEMDHSTMEMDEEG